MAGVIPDGYADRVGRWLAERRRVRRALGAVSVGVAVVGGSAWWFTTLDVVAVAVSVGIRFLVLAATASLALQWYLEVS